MTDETPVDAVFDDVGESVLHPPAFVVKNFLPVGVTFLNGPPKSYKSASLLAGCMTAAGIAHRVLPPDMCELPDEDDEGVVMGLSLEGEAGVLRYNAKVGFGVDIPSNKMWVVSDPFRFRLDNQSNMAELLHYVGKVKPRIFFIDPLRNAHSLDENDSGGMIGMIQPLQRYAVTNNMAIVIVHHSKKLEDEKGNGRTARASDMRGTSALFGLADAVITHTKKSVGLVHLDAVFKRGEPWEKTIQLGIWGAIPTESIDSLTKQIFDKLASGMTASEVAEAMHLSKLKVSAAITQLLRIGALTPEGKIAPSGHTIVANAVRRFG
jgi:hypothetical protein